MVIKNVGIKRKVGFLIFSLMFIFGLILTLALVVIILDSFKKTASDLPQPSIKFDTFYVNSFLDSLVTQVEIISQRRAVSLILADNQNLLSKEEKSKFDKSYFDSYALSKELYGYKENNDLIINIILIDKNFKVIVSADKVGNQMLKADEKAKQSNEVIYNEPL